MNNKKTTVITVSYAVLMEMAQNTGVEPYTSGNGIQCGFSLPNGHTWLIAWAELPVDVTIYDNVSGTDVKIHDKI